MKMMLMGKVGMEKITITGDLPEINNMIVDATMLPIIKSKGSKSYYSQYKTPASIRNNAYGSWIKRLAYEKPLQSVEVGFNGLYKAVPFIDNKIPTAFYFDGSYVNKPVKNYKEYSNVFSIYFNTGHKTRIEESAKYMGVEVDEWFHVDYGNYLQTNHRYVHGTKWLAGCIGASFANNVIIPSTNDFWATERSNFIYTEGADWISRYYGDVVGLFNPIKDTKADILDNLDKKFDILLPCRCGKCMECITTYAVLNKKLHDDFFKDDPRRSEEYIKSLKSAVANGKAEEYRRFIEE